jgi:hypothetical protein
MALIRFLVLLSLTSPAFAGIGEVTEVTGMGQIKRQSNKIDADMYVSIEMNDYIKTAKGIVGITFDDDTQVRVDQHSELVIDDFVYDPATSQGSLGLKIALGTVKYASGNIAHNNPDTVDIETPSATIAVRGTAFTMTVDETGRSLVILVPNIDGSVGEIEVMTDVGSVIMNRAFQATTVRSRSQMPSKPMLLSINESMINNFLIISPPKKLIREMVADNQNEILGDNGLSINFLDYNELDKNDLSFNSLDINELDMALLLNILDLEAMGTNIDGNFEGYNPSTGVITIFEESVINVIRIAENSRMDIRFGKETGINTTVTQGEATINIITLSGDSTNNIRIIQK